MEVDEGGPSQAATQAGTYLPGSLGLGRAPCVCCRGAVADYGPALRSMQQPQGHPAAPTQPPHSRPLPASPVHHPRGAGSPQPH